MRSRTKIFVIDLLKFLKTLPESYEVSIISKQLFRSASSIAANYRAACRSRSNKEFYSKISIVVEETDETLFWLELLIESGISDNENAVNLLNTATEFIKIFSKTRKTIGVQLKS